MISNTNYVVGPVNKYVYSQDGASKSSECTEGFYKKQACSIGKSSLFPSMQTIVKVLKVASFVVAVLTALAALAMLPPLSVPVPAYVAISLPTLISSSSVFAGSTLVDFLVPKHIAVNCVQKQNATTKTVNGQAAAIVTHNGQESFQWKKRLIEAAQKNIVLSGNYCGGESFDEVLELIKEKCEKNSEIVVTILSSSRWLTESNKKMIDGLKLAYPERFALIPTDDIWTVNPGMKKVTNHTKALSIDDGAYFMTGGSGIENKYAYFHGTGDRSTVVQENNGGWLANLVMPRGFRDMDFVFRSDSSSSSEEISVGAHFHTEVLTLAQVWNDYNKRFRVDSPEAIQRNNRVIATLNKQLEKFSPPYTTRIKNFDIHSQLAEKSDVRVYSTGPEMEESSFYKAIIEKIKNAKEHIYIDHMYYHPTREIEEALAEAANRGLQVHILTNDNQKFSPAGHKLFGRRNRHHCYTLFHLINEENRKNLHVYFYGQKYENTPKNTSIHKKMIVIDDYVIAGSSNLGYKSMVTMSDHEINFIARSKEMAEKAIEVFKNDAFSEREAQNEERGPALDKQGNEIGFVTLSRPADEERDLRRTSIADIFYARVHKLGAFLFG